MKPKRRIISFLLAICLVAGLVPTAAFAAGTDTGKAIQLGTSGISDPTSTQDNSGTYYTPSDYVYFGVNGSDPIKWRVLDADKTNDGTTSGMFLLSEYLLASGVAFEMRIYGSDNDGQAVPNEWQHSDAQNWCNNFAKNNNVFSTAEQTAFLGVTKNDTPEEIFYPILWGESSLTENDKVFFLSVRELADYVSNYIGAPGLIATDTAQSAGEWWLRSPYAEDPSSRYAGVVTDNGDVESRLVRAEGAARPAFNLDLNSVLFTSAAEGGKIPAANGGGNQGGEAADAIFEIGDYDGNEWKLTLLDDSREFGVTEDTASGKPGDTITLNYTGATTGANEYISVIIADNEGAKYYGRITQPTSESGTVAVKIPANLADGSYTLRVFSEQYNGGEKDDTKLTDYASAFEAVTLNVSSDTTAPTLTGGSATRTSDTAATVKFTSNEAGSYYYTVVESGAAEPDVNSSGTGTDCDTTEQTISLTTLTEGAKDIYIVVKDAAGNISGKLKIEIPAYVAPSYGISADPSKLDFGRATEGYSSAPAAQTVTITNTGNQTITLNQPTATDFNIGTLSTTDLAAGGTATFTVQPKPGLAAGSHNETLTISGTKDTSASVTLAFQVAPKQYLVTVNGSYASTTGAGEYAVDATVNIFAGSRSNYSFNGWTSDDVTIDNASSKNASFVMPEKNVTVTAQWTANGTTTPTVNASSGIDVWYNGGNSFGTSKSAVPTAVEIDGVPVSFTGNGSEFTVGCISPNAKRVTVNWNSTSVTTNFTPDANAYCTQVQIPKTGDMSFWTAIAEFFGF